MEVEIISENEDEITFIHPILQDPKSCKLFRDVLYTKFRAFAVGTVLEIVNKKTIVATEVWAHRLGQLIIRSYNLSPEVLSYTFLLKVKGSTDENGNHRLTTTDDLILISVDEKPITKENRNNYPSIREIFDHADLFPLRINEEIELIIYVVQGTSSSYIKFSSISKVIHRRSPEHQNKFLITVRSNGMYTPRQIIDYGLIQYFNEYVEKVEEIEI